MKRGLSFLVVFAFVSVAFTATLPLSVFHYNDEHSMNLPQPTKNPETGKIDSIGGIQYIAGQLAVWRKDAKRSITLVAGDEFTGGAISALTKGSGQADILNLIKPDVMCVGNHEFDYGISALQAFQFRLDTSITLASANLFDKVNNKQLFASGKIIKRDGIKIAVLALTLEGLADVVHPDRLIDIEVQPVVPIARAFVEKMQPDADVIIAVTHQGAVEDSLLAMQVPGFDLIVGGHSHTLINRDWFVNGTRIVQAGSSGRYLGRVDLQVDTENNEVVSSTYKVVPIGKSYRTPMDPKAIPILRAQEVLVSKELDQPLGKLDGDFIRVYDGESNVGTWVCEALQSYMKTDIGLYNSGGIRVDVFAGTITKKQLWQLEPFGNSIAKATVTGAELKRMFEYRATVEGDFIQTSGVTVTIKSGQVTDLTVNGVAFDPAKIYSIATNSYVTAQWEKYFGFPLGQSNVVDMGTPTKEVLMLDIEAKKTIVPHVTGWWKKSE
ncbi:MAG: bifunctional metallophosphatase/5'-nucleotidase [bacterium]|nr:bifunctional metallophosphatase/5'-nucleotidase [bacterium]